MSYERFEEYYVKYKDYVKRIVFEKISDRDMADDIAQDVFLAFFQNIYKVMPGLEKAWLYRSARNASVDYIRKVSRKPEIQLDAITMDNELYQAAEGMEAVEKRLDDCTLLQEIMIDLKKTNPVWYDALRLFCLEEYSYEEAARQLGVSVAVLRARVYRARAFVRERYGDF
ncbi:MAG: RNA polymerase sigma factor [Lachnospiraceae bacterium]|nr:RNA polymerase sigma factor [Lachnospiraceae bacterium]